MEFASEMVVKATLAGQRITSTVPTRWPRTAGAGRRTCTPGGMAGGTCGSAAVQPALAVLPAWPGAAGAGLVIGAIVAPHPFSVGGVTFDVDTLVGASAMVVIGFQAVLFWLFTQVYAGSEGFLPEGARGAAAAGQAVPGARPDPRLPDRPGGLVGLIFSLL